MNEAREKAKEEVEKYRAEMEQQFAEKESNVTTFPIPLTFSPSVLDLKRKLKNLALRPKKRLLLSSKSFFK